MDPAAVQLVESTDRALVPLLLKLDQYIDLVIPRGGESLIRAVVAESTIPVLKHFAGNCHIYVMPTPPRWSRRGAQTSASTPRPVTRRRVQRGRENNVS